jgi:hypothetical protein
MKARVWSGSRFYANGRPAAESGTFLLEAIVYLGAFWVICGLSIMVYFRAMTASRELRQATEDVTQTVSAGERWRQDIRDAVGQIKLAAREREMMLEIPQSGGVVGYQFDGERVQRRASASGRWATLIRRVKACSMSLDAAQPATAWRWELELAPISKKPGRLRPLFTFEAVARKVE